MKCVFLMLFACAALAASSAVGPPGVTATRLDGTALSGEITAWTDHEVIINAGDGDEHVATKELVALRWRKADPAQTPVNSLPSLVELTDGTILPAADFAVRGTNGTVTLDAPPPSGQKGLSVPLAQVAAVRLRPLETNAAAQWDEIRSQNLTSDVLVVLKRDGKSLDYVEGVLGEVTPDNIEFKLDDKPLRIDRAKIAGFVYFRSNRKTKSEPQCIMHGSTGLRASATRTRLVNDMMHITTVSGVAFKWPLSDLHLADFSAGKIVYLSDIEPASKKWTPFVGLPPDAELVGDFGQPRRDQSAFGGPLSLHIPEHNLSGGSRLPRSYEKGLAIRSRTQLVYRLPAEFRRFVAITGIEPATSSTGNVRLTIYADDYLAFEADIVGNQPPAQIDLDMQGIKRIKIVVDFGQNLDTGDWLNLCEARLIK